MHLPRMAANDRAGTPPAPIALVDSDRTMLAGSAGTLRIRPHDQVTLKLAMLYEGQCAGLGATRAAAKFGYTRQGYYRLLHRFHDLGTRAFFQRSGPKTNYRRREEIIRVVVRHRFQNLEASGPELVRRLRDSGFRISARSVERILTEYGLRQRAHSKTRAKAHRRPSVRLSLLPRVADIGTERSVGLGQLESAANSPSFAR